MMRRLGAVIVVLASLVAGCSLPHPKNSHGTTKIAATQAEAEQIYERYRIARRSALELLDEEPLVAVESGEVLAIDTGALMVARRLLLSEAPDDTQQLRILDVYAPRLDSYPLWFVAIVEDGVRDLTKVQIFERASSVAPWHLVASPEVVPTTEVPPFERDSTGAVESIDPGSSRGLSMSPREAIETYAEALKDPAAADPEVSENSFVTQMGDVAEQQSQIDGVAFRQEWSARPAHYALRAADGGAIVFGTLSRVDRYQIEEGRYIDWPDDSEQEAFLSGRLYSSGELRYYHQVLAYVPPKDGQPVVLGQYGGVVEGLGY